MNNKRKLFIINWGGDYEIWLSHSKESAAQSYFNQTGYKVCDEECTVSEITLEEILSNLKMADDVTLSTLQDELDVVMKMDEDVMFITNML